MLTVKQFLRVEERRRTYQNQPPEQSGDLVDKQYERKEPASCPGGGIKRDRERGEDEAW